MSGPHRGEPPRRSKGHLGRAPAPNHRSPRRRGGPFGTRFGPSVGTAIQPPSDRRGVSGGPPPTTVPPDPHGGPFGALRGALDTELPAIEGAARGDPPHPPPFPVATWRALWGPLGPSMDPAIHSSPHSKEQLGRTPRPTTILRGPIQGPLGSFGALSGTTTTTFSA